MIYNGQKNEDYTQLLEQPDIESIALEAEICFASGNSVSALTYWQRSGIIIVPVSDMVNDSGYLLRLKKQIHIHREIKPELDHQSGHHFRHYSPPEEPHIS